MTAGGAQRASLPPLTAGQEALKRRSWAEAQQAFEQAVRERATPEAYEGLSWAAWWRADPETVFAAREAAFRLYRERGDDLGAARAAMWLAADYADFRGELSVASGWRQRARRLLDGAPLSLEHGWALLLEGDAALLLEGDTVTAKRAGAEAIAIGAALHTRDFEVLGLALQGLALVDEGCVEDGMRMLDEAGVATLAGELKEPLWGSWALCYLLYACERARDFERAIEWCERARLFAEQFELVAGQAVCRVHYAAVLIWRGDWPAAEAQLTAAATMLQASRPPWAAEALVRLADLRRRQGRLADAAAIFTQVEWHPLALFGLAELALDSGKPRDAQDLIERALRRIPETSRHQRALALELKVRTEALLGNADRAAAALESLEELCGKIAAPPLRAAALFSAGIVAVEAHEYESAMRHFEDSLDLFERGGAPYEVARTRLELASTLVALDRLERARVEAAAAHEILLKLDSRLYSGRAAALLRDIDRRAGPGGKSTRKVPELTNRQVQVLRLIAHGRSDRQIASSLGVSEHTVHRHVANILNRLELRTRAAAAAHAATRGLI
jgi:LuxR family transcriptional regulator, maltose regulon positive regulatory protein